MTQNKIGVITREEVQVLLSRRLQRATPIDPEMADRVAIFLLDSEMVTAYTMFYEQDDVKEKK